MPSSLCQVAVHVIFATKLHKPLLTDDIHYYIHGIITNNKGIPISINGTADHVHILCFLPKDCAVSDFVRSIKASSSKWFKTKNPLMEWQAGYAAFGVSKTNIHKVEEYINIQKEHHRGMDFAEEMSLYFKDSEGKEIYRDWFEVRG